MAVENLKATLRGVKGTIGHGDAGMVKAKSATVEVTAAASATSTYSFFRIPSNARILGTSRIATDDLASTGSPTLDVGLFAVKGNITDDDDAFKADIDVATAATDARLFTDIAKNGKYAWEFVNGQTSDPGGEFEVKATIKDAATNTGGTISIELFYILD